MSSTWFEILSAAPHGFCGLVHISDIMFPEKGVRFIAVNNGVDSETMGDNDFTPFLNIMNERYAKDTSQKIRAIFKAKMQEGKRVSPSVPYGYLRDPQDKQHLIIDEEPAEVVRRIYRLVIEGVGVSAIARHFKFSPVKFLHPHQVSRDFSDVRIMEGPSAAFRPDS